MPSNTTFTPNNLTQFTSDKVHFDGKHAEGTIAAGTTDNIDLHITDDVLITGGVFMTKDGVWGDSVVLQVVDIDNVLGYGANVTLNQFVAWFLPNSPAAGTLIQLQVPYPAKIFAGLYLRMRFTSVGTTDVQVAMNYMLHKVMI